MLELFPWTDVSLSPQVLIEFSRREFLVAVRSIVLYLPLLNGRSWLSQ